MTSAFGSGRPAVGPGSVTAALLLLTVLAPEPAAAQAGTDSADAARQRKERRQVMIELRRVNRQLTKIRRRALRDSSLLPKRDSLRRLVRRRMRAMDDTTAARVDRVAAAEDSLRRAERTGETALGRSAMEELRELEELLRGARSEAMRQPAVRKRLQSFQEALLETMRRIDRRTDSLSAVRDSLMEELRGGTGASGDGRGGR